MVKNGILHTMKKEGKGQRHLRKENARHLIKIWERTQILEVAGIKVQEGSLHRKYTSSPILHSEQMYKLFPQQIMKHATSMMMVISNTIS
jgi:hypothetical protein